MLVKRGRKGGRNQEVMVTGRKTRRRNPETSEGRRKTEEKEKAIKNKKRS